MTLLSWRQVASLTFELTTSPHPLRWSSSTSYHERRLGSPRRLGRSQPCVVFEWLREAQNRRRQAAGTLEKGKVLHGCCTASVAKQRFGRTRQLHPEFQTTHLVHLCPCMIFLTLCLHTRIGAVAQHQAQSTLGLLTPMIEDAFELKDKSQAQREMERWSAERTRERDQTRHAAKPRRFSAPIDTASPTPQPAANQSAAAQEQTLQEPSASASQEPHRTADAMTVHEADAPEVVEELCEPNLVVHLEEPEEASMQDIVILQQRMQLEQLRRDKSTAEHERESLRSQVASLQRSFKSGSPSHTSCEAGDMSGDSLSGSSSSSSGRARGEVLKPFLQKSLRTLKAAGVGQRRTLALGVLILGTLALVFRMLTRVDRESMPDTEWDLEIDHSEMQRLVAALTADKAHAALRGGLATVRGNGTMALDRDLVSVKTILNDLHRKSLKNHGHAATQLVRDNLRLESELRQLRSQIAS